MKYPCSGISGKQPNNIERDLHRRLQKFFDSPFIGSVEPMSIPLRVRNPDGEVVRRMYGAIAPCEMTHALWTQGPEEFQRCMLGG